MMTSSNGNILINIPRYWPFVRGIHWSPVNSPHKGQWCGALMFTLICARVNCSVNNREAGDLRRYRTHYDVIVMSHEILSRADVMTWKRFPLLVTLARFLESTGYRDQLHKIFSSKVNIWNVNCARATAVIFDTQTDILVKVSKFLRQKMSRPEGDSIPQP